MFGRYLSSAICLRLRWKPNWDNPKKCMECWPQSSFALIVFCLSHRNYEVVPSFSLPSLDASSFFWFVLIYIKVCSNPNQCYKLALPVMLAGLYTPSTIVTFLMYFWKKKQKHLRAPPRLHPEDLIKSPLNSINSPFFHCAETWRYVDQYVSDSVYTCPPPNKVQQCRVLGAVSGGFHQSPRKPGRSSSGWSELNP